MFWLGIIGFLWWASSRLTLRSVPFLGAAALNTLLLFQKGTLVPFYFWSFKRYIPLVIPAFMLFMAFALWELWPKRESGRWQQAILPFFIGGYLLVAYVDGSFKFLESCRLYWLD